jgi:hypothetical protein
MRTRRSALNKMPKRKKRDQARKRRQLRRSLKKLVR